MRENFVLDLANPAVCDELPALLHPACPAPELAVEAGRGARFPLASGGLALESHDRIADERGTLEVVFKEADGWVLVDYKTDHVDAASLDQHARRYAPQVQLYAEAWRRNAGEAVVEMGLFFVGAGRYVRLEG